MNQSKSLMPPNGRINIDTTEEFMAVVQKMGSSGKYQRILTYLFSAIWFVTGIILMSTSYTFLNVNFDCAKVGLVVKDCQTAVCQLPKEEWEQFVDRSTPGQSVATEFGSYLCDDEAFMDLISSSTYIGAFVGYVVFSFFSDNFGRRKSMLLSWGVATIGAIVFSLSSNLWMVAAGLFMRGAGSDAAINICFYFYGQIYSNHLRQLHSIRIQVFFCAGALFTVLVSYLIPNWRIVSIITVSIPCAVILFFFAFYVEETPQFVARKGVKKTLLSLNRIAKINFGVRGVFQEEDVKKIIELAKKRVKDDKIITLVDLIRYKSLRKITILSSLINFVLYAMYYAPTLIVSTIGFNVYVSGAIVQLSQIYIYLPAYLYINQIRRRNWSIKLILISVICSSVLIFVQKPKDCQLCVEGFLQIIFIFIFRSAVAMCFCICYVYFTELFPARARAIGSGIASAFGTLASSSCPIFIGTMRRNGINIMPFFTIMGIIIIGLFLMLPETFNKRLEYEIEQLKVKGYNQNSELVKP